jgi:hypothetical protein
MLTTRRKTSEAQTPEINALDLFGKALSSVQSSKKKTKRKTKRTKDSDSEASEDEHDVGCEVTEAPAQAAAVEEQFGSADSPSGSESAQSGAENMCGECGLVLEEGAQKYLHWPCHYRCGTSKRSLILKSTRGKNTQQKKLVKKSINKLKKEKPESYFKIIRLMNKESKKGKGARDAASTNLAIANIDSFIRVNSMSKLQDAELMNKKSFIRNEISLDFKGTMEQKVQRAASKWERKTKDPSEHTEYENGELVLAIKNNTKFRSENKLQIDGQRKEANPKKLEKEASKGFTQAMPKVFLESGGRVLLKASASVARKSPLALPPRAANAIEVAGDSDGSDDEEDEEELEGGQEEDEEEEEAECEEDDEDGNAVRRRIRGKGVRCTF